TSGAPVRADAATAPLARMAAALAARDADALPALIAEGFEWFDHTTGVALDRQGGLSSLRWFLRAENPTLVHEMLATLGDSLALGPVPTPPTAVHPPPPHLPPPPTHTTLP